MFDATLFGQLMLPALPTTVALAMVAALGYLVGRHSRLRDALAAQARRNLEQTLDDTKQLERITDDMLKATRQALAECRRISLDSRTDGGAGAPPASRNRAATEKRTTKANRPSPSKF